MRTRTVRTYERDVDRIRKLARLGQAGSFATAAQLVVDQASNRVAKRTGAQKVVADQGEGAHQAEVLQGGLGSRFVPFRFTSASRDVPVDDARFLVEKGLVELPIEPDDVRRTFANVQATEDGYHHPNRRLKDVCDAIGLSLSDVKGRGRSAMRLLTATRSAPRHPTR